MYGRYRDADMAVFRLKRCTGDASNRRPQGYAHDVCGIRMPGAQWPRFSVRPRRWRDVFRSASGNPPYLFSTPPGFAARYVVQCDQAALLQDRLTNPMREWCLRHPKHWVEGEGAVLLLFKRPAMLKPNLLKISDFERLYRMGTEWVDMMVL